MITDAQDDMRRWSQERIERLTEVAGQIRRQIDSFHGEDHPASQKLIEAEAVLHEAARLLSEQTR